ncbi:MAG: hypothetical protein AAGI53_09475 [Planctomycetota bacterium]
MPKGKLSPRGSRRPSPAQVKDRARVDDRNFRAIMAALRKARARVGAKTLRAGAEVFVDVVTEITPRDTNRLVRGWVLAANDAGLDIRAVPPIRPSTRRDQWLEALTEQVDYWQGKVKRFAGLRELYEREDRANPLKKDGTPRKRRTRQPYYRKLGRRLRQAERRLGRAEEELAKAAESEGFLFFDRGGFAFGSGSYTKSGLRKLTSVRDQLYGGTGEVRHVNRKTYLRLHNLEPHATLIERNAKFGHPVRTAMGVAKQLGVRRMSRKAVRELRQVQAEARRGGGSAGGSAVAVSVPVGSVDAGGETSSSG